MISKTQQKKERKYIIKTLLQLAALYRRQAAYYLSLAQLYEAKAEKLNHVR